MERLYSDRFSWTITETDRGLQLVLTDHEKSKTKSFFQAAVSAERMTQHLNSLTDELCEGFWPRPKEKKAKKPKDQ